MIDINEIKAGRISDVEKVLINSFSKYRYESFGNGCFVYRDDDDNVVYAYDSVNQTFRYPSFIKLYMIISDIDNMNEYLHNIYSKYLDVPIKKLELIAQ